MKIVAYYKKIIPKKEIKFESEKTKNKRPSWIKISGLPKGTNFIKVNYGEKGLMGQRVQFYKTYLPEGFFIPVDYNSEEMKNFYNKFSEFYDVELIKGGVREKQNFFAVEFLIEKIKKYVSNVEFLDLGAGTGIMTELFILNGYGPANLVDYSQKMIDKAKKRRTLKGSKFFVRNFKDLDLGKKFGLIISTFSFGATSYFSKNEIEVIINVAKKHLREKGIIAMIGHLPLDQLKKNFKAIDSGIYDLSGSNKYYTDYFIGIKR